MPARSSIKRQSESPRPVIQEPPLPKLLVGLYEGTDLMRVTEMDDPRARFCLSYNEMAGKHGYTARPLLAEGTVANA